MKPISSMTRVEVAAYISSAFQQEGIRVILSGGACVSIYSEDKYVSMDLDFINADFAKRHQLPPR